MNKCKGKIISVISSTNHEVIMQIEGDTIRRLFRSNKLILWKKDEVIGTFETKLQYQMTNTATIYYKIMV